MPVDAPALGYTFIPEHPLIYAPPNTLIHEIAGITSNADKTPGFGL
jgi:hypothetical protein